MSSSESKYAVFGVLKASIDLSIHPQTYQSRVVYPSINNPLPPPYGRSQSPPLRFLVIALNLISDLKLRPAFKCHPAFSPATHFCNVFFLVFEGGECT